uniref:Uncharacterized protein n=1 Tax=Oryza sativa subsp. japonica TaxID=39947 RepID=Q67VH9_ORYSJ|nr:hypothetical protein [Oryza sativa Japonica Group]
MFYAFRFTMFIKRKECMRLHPTLALRIEIGKIAKIWEICRFPPEGRSDRLVWAGQTGGMWPV